MRTASALRWGGCLALALALHAGGAYALIARWQPSATDVASAPAILIDFAPEAAAPAPPTDLPPAPPAPQAEAQPPTPPEPVTPVEDKPPPEKPAEQAAEKPADIKPPPTAEESEVKLPPPRPTPPKEVERKPPQRQASLASAPAAAAQRAPRAVAAAPGTSERHSDAVPNWRSALVAQIERYKRYPEEARARGDQGVAQVAFSVDRSGGVHDARLVHSSGSSLLDRDALAWIARAQPLPPPPPELPGALISVVVPLRYFVR